MVSVPTTASRLVWYLIPVRVLLVTFLLTLLSFAISLFVGILFTLIWSALHGARPDMTTAYRYVAAPFAALVAGVVLISATTLEIRRYRQARVLAAIERAG